MRVSRSFRSCCFATCVVIMIGLIGCSPTAKKTSPGPEQVHEAVVPAFHVDTLTAGSISGTIRYSGKRPAQKKIDMSEDPACVAAHHGKASDESLVVSSSGLLANAFIYVKSGLEGKRFETPTTPVVIDQNGCWFTPRVIGIQTNQILQVTNSDPVTHNIHPMAQINREWNHSQGAGEAPIGRKFVKPEVMIRVKCNIHSWMHAYIGVVDSPYFAVSNADGTYSIKNLPPGTYTIDAWQENLGIQERQITVAPHSNTLANITFKEH
jgi:carboxypeptidase family protein